VNLKKECGEIGKKMNINRSSKRILHGLYFTGENINNLTYDIHLSILFDITTHIIKKDVAGYYDSTNWSSEEKFPSLDKIIPIRCQIGECLLLLQNKGYITFEASTIPDGSDNSSFSDSSNPEKNYERSFKSYDTLYHVTITPNGVEMARGLNTFLGRLNIKYIENKDNIYNLIITIIVSIVTTFITIWLKG
jgi:hypothetical protein